MKPEVITFIEATIEDNIANGRGHALFEPACEESRVHWLMFLCTRYQDSYDGEGVTYQDIAEYWDYVNQNRSQQEDSENQ